MNGVHVAIVRIEWYCLGLYILVINIFFDIISSIYYSLAASLYQ